ncbi:MAG: hypothetical protein V7749_01870 [Cocleimonas sp.]
MRQIKKDGRLPQEKMTTLAAVLFIPAIVIFALLFKSISNWRTDIRQEQNRIEIESFIASVYEPLANSRSTLRTNLLEMQTLIQKVETMELIHPNHIDLIRMVRQQWSLGHASLYQAYTETDKEVRRAWIAHNTMDRQDVLLKFSKQAVQIEAQIKKAQTNYQTHLYSVQGEMVKMLDRARKLLSSNRSPPKSKQQIAINQQLREKIRPLNPGVTTDLLNFIGSLDMSLKGDMEILHELIRVASQQSAIIRDHLYKNRDLEQPLTKIINDWKLLEDKTNKSLQQIYYAIEAEYVVLRLGLLQDSPSIKAMNQTLLKTIPAIKGEGLKQKKRIDQSYSINLSGN